MGYLGKKPAEIDVDIEDASISATELAANSVDSSELVDGSIDTSHIAASQVTLAKMAANSIDSDQYVDGSIDTAHIAASQITNALMADDAIDSAEIADGAIDLAHMSVNSIDSDQYVDGSIDAAHLAPAQTNITSLGTLTALVVDDITINGSTISDGGDLTIQPAGDLVIDAGTDIVLDTGGADIFIKDDGTTIAKFTNSSSNFVITSEVDDKDIIFKGQDSTSEITALSLDMSAAGDAHFNRNVGIGAAPTNGGISTAGSPVLSISGAVPELNFVDTDSGKNDYWIRVSDGLQFGEAGDSRMYLKNGGNLGIGNTTAGHKLDVSGDAQISYAGDGNSPSLHVLDTADTEVAWFEGHRAGDTGAFISIYHNPSSIAQSNRCGLRFQGGNDAGQKINYGMFLQRITDYTDGTEDGELQTHLMVNGTLEEKLTITPDQLRFRGDAGSSIIRVDNRADGHDTGFEIYQNTSRKWEIVSDDSNTDALSIRNNAGTEKYTFTQAGSVGINNSAPSYALDIDPPAATAFRILNATNDQDLNCTLTNSGTGTGTDTLFDLTTAGGAGDPKVRWSISGNENYEMGIDNSDSDRLKISNGTALGTSDIAVFTGGRMYVGGYGGPTWPGILVAEKDQAGVPMLTVRAHNADAIGATFHVNSQASGNNSIISCWNNSQNSSTADQQFRVRNDGTCFTNNGNTSSLSDRRLKKNIVDYTYDLSKFKSLRTRKFDWENKELHGNKDDVIGFIAQEVDAVDSRWVMQDQLHTASKDVPLVDADLLTFATPLSETDAMYVSVIQQLITRLETAEAKIAVLEG